MQKVVTMIMPCFNSAPYLDYMLDSIYHQTYDCIQLIVAYDNSTDGTLNILKNWKRKFDNRGYEYIIVRNPARAGIIGGINSAMPYFTGDYITFPDSDDFLYPEFTSTMVEALENNPSYGWARCDNIKVIGRDIAFDKNGLGDFNSEVEYDEIYDLAYDERYAHLGNVMNFLLYTIPRAPWRMMCRRNFLNKAIPEGIFYPHPSSHELPIALPLANTGEFLHIKKPLYKYTIHKDGYYNSRMQDLHKLIPYFDSMQQLAGDCINLLPVDNEIKSRYQLANNIYYYATKAYYAKIHRADSLSAKYAEWLIENMREFAGNDIIDDGFPKEIYWKYFYRLAPKIVTHVKMEESRELFDKKTWEKIKAANHVILYGAGNNCSEIMPILEDQKIKIDEIWDVNADYMEEKFGLSIVKMHGEKAKDSYIIVTILKSEISKQVYKDLAGLGYQNIVLAKELDMAFRYAMLEQYFPWML